MFYSKGVLSELVSYQISSKKIWIQNMIFLFGAGRRYVYGGEEACGVGLREWGKKENAGLGERYHLRANNLTQRQVFKLTLMSTVDAIR